MLPTTLEAVKSILRADPSVSTPDRARLVALLRNGGPEKSDAAHTAPAVPEIRIIPRPETAHLLGRSPKAVDLLVKQGLLHRVVLPGRVRGAGFRAADVFGLIAGNGGDHGQG